MTPARSPAPPPRASTARRSGDDKGDITDYGDDKGDVKVILDKGQRTAKYSSADFVAHAGILTMIDSRHAIAHNKVMVIDGGVVITGSFNFTKAAEEKNAENLLVIRDCKIAEQYTNNWGCHAEHSEKYAGR